MEQRNIIQSWHSEQNETLWPAVSNVHFRSTQDKVSPTRATKKNKNNSFLNYVSVWHKKACAGEVCADIRDAVKELWFLYVFHKINPDLIFF